MSIFKYKKSLLGILLFLAFAAWAYHASVVRLSKNFYEIDPGKFYRSAQLTPEELEEVIAKYGIKTVISLRGAPENSYWVPGQVQTLQKHNVAFYHFGWTTDYFPETDRLKGYLQAIEKAERPILVHCRTGADRTGEATAMYAIDYMGYDNQKAIDQYLNFKYWHVPAFHPAKTAFVKNYKGLKWSLENYELCTEENKRWIEPGHCTSIRSESKSTAEQSVQTTGQ